MADEQAEKERIRNDLRELHNLVAGTFSIDVAPKFQKACSLLDTRTPYLRVVCKLPVYEDEQYPMAGQDSDISLFQIPYNHLNSFEYSPDDRKATLVISDKTGAVADMFMLSQQILQFQSSSSQMNVYIDWGWVPTAQNLPKKIKDSVYFFNSTYMYISDIKYEFRDTSINLTLELASDETSFSSQNFDCKPYDVLGPAPLANYVLNEIRALYSVTDLQRVEESFTKIMTQYFHYNDESVKTRVIEEVKKNIQNGNTNVSATLQSNLPSIKEITTTIEDVYNENEYIEKHLKIAERINGFNKTGRVFGLSTTPDNVIEDLQWALPFIGEIKLHPYEAFMYLFKSMTGQLLYNNEELYHDALLARYFDENDIVEKAFLDKMRNTADPWERFVARLETEENEDLTSFIRVKDLVCNRSTSWEGILQEVANRISIKTNGESEDNANTNGVVLDIFLDKVIPTGQETSPFDIESSKQSGSPVTRNIYKILLAFDDALDLKEDLKLAPKFKKAVQTQYSNGPGGGRSFQGSVYAILSPKEQSALFVNVQETNKIYQKYVYRPFNKANSGYFSRGENQLSQASVPDVISFTPEFSPRQAVLAALKTQTTEASTKIGDLVVRANREQTFDSVANSSARNAVNQSGADEQSRAIRQEQAKQQAENNYLLIRESIIGNHRVNVSLDRAMDYAGIIGSESTAAIETKLALQNFRKRLSYLATGIKAELVIDGEPFYNYPLSNIYIYLIINNPDGTESFFSGIWQILKRKHSIASGKFTTSLEINKVPVNSVDPTGGLATRLAARDSINLELIERKPDGNQATENTTGADEIKNN